MVFSLAAAAALARRVNPRRALFGLLAVMFALLALYAYTLRIQVSTARAETATAYAHRDAAQVAQKAAEKDRDAWRTSYYTLRAEIAAANAANAEAYKQAQQQSAEAMQKLKADKARADDGARAQMGVIQSQDQACKSALKSLDTYCAGVGEL